MKDITFDNIVEFIIDEHTTLLDESNNDVDILENFDNTLKIYYEGDDIVNYSILDEDGEPINDNLREFQNEQIKSMVIDYYHTEEEEEEDKRTQEEIDFR